MMDLWQSISGMYEVELVTAAPEERLREITEKGIAVYQVKSLSELTIQLRISRKDHTALKKLCTNRGDILKVHKGIGLFFVGASLCKRPILVVGICTLLFLTWFLSTRVLFISVAGNNFVPEKRILEAAEEYGLHFGALRRSIRSEQVKNELLGSIPELKWAGVNTYGCVAVISVREAEVPEAEEKSFEVGNVIALRDGVVLDCTASKGTLLCKPGDVVQKGQILISGYTDCGRILQATEAQGEVFAQTLRSVQVKKLLSHRTRGEKQAQHNRYSIIIGKKRINLWKDSGIWDTTCGRMYREYVLALPGGFRLPVALCVERITQYELTETISGEEEVSEELRGYAEDYLLEQMNAGRIRTGSFQISRENDVASLAGNYICTEMIGRIQPEQIGEYDGKTD